MQTLCFSRWGEKLKICKRPISVTRFDFRFLATAGRFDFEISGILVRCGFVENYYYAEYERLRFENGSKSALHKARNAHHSKWLGF